MRFLDVSDASIAEPRNPLRPHTANPQNTLVVRCDCDGANGLHGENTYDAC